MHDAAPLLTDWLTAIGGLLVFVATAWLAWLARKQMQHMRRQAEAVQDQVGIMRETAEADAHAVREQIAASVAQSEAVKEAARAQLQPLVFAHGYKMRPEPDATIFFYWLENEGVGPALDIEHGVELAGKQYAHGFPEVELRFRALRSGESAPEGMPVATGTPVPDLMSVRVPWDGQSPVYWTRFSNAFDERFELRNPQSPTDAAEFRRL